MVSTRRVETRMKCFVVTLMIAAMAPVPARATRWVGIPTSEGAVQRHPDYQQILTTYPMILNNFDHLPSGVNIVGQNLQGLVVHPNPPDAHVVTRVGTAAGVPSVDSGTALEILATPGEPANLTIYFLQPVQVAGFVAMNLNTPYYLTTFDLQGKPISRVLMPAVPLGNRQWIGLDEGGGNLFSLKIEPLGSITYGIDNLEYSRHAPEPSTLGLWILAGIGFVRRRARVTVRAENPL